MKIETMEVKTMEAKKRGRKPKDPQASPKKKDEKPEIEIHEKVSDFWHDQSHTYVQVKEWKGRKEQFVAILEEYLNQGKDYF